MTDPEIKSVSLSDVKFKTKRQQYDIVWLIGLVFVILGLVVFLSFN